MDIVFWPRAMGRVPVPGSCEKVTEIGLQVKKSYRSSQWSLWYLLLRNVVLHRYSFMPGHADDSVTLTVQRTAVHYLVLLFVASTRGVRKATIIL